MRSKQLGCKLDAAEHICGSEFSAEDVFDAVSNLVDKSILIREQSGPVARFRMLETIREYGQEKASETGDHADLRRAYASGTSSWRGTRRPTGSARDSSTG